MKTIPVFLCADQNVFVGVCVTLTSALINLKDNTQLDIYLFNLGFSKKEEKKLRYYLDRIRKPYVLQVLETENLNSLIFTDNLRKFHGNYTAFFKVLMPSFLKLEIPIIYLDSDVVVCMDLVELYEQDLHGMTLGAVLESPVSIAFEQEFYLSQGFDLESMFFNSGVMLIDLKRWNETQISEQCLELMKKHGKDLMGDQTILNVIFKDKFTILPKQYNQLCFPSRSSMKHDNAYGIYHLVGRPKPWEFLGEFFNRQSPLFFFYLDQIDSQKWRSYKNIKLNSLLRSFRIFRSYFKALKSRII